MKNPSLMCVFSKLNPAKPWASAPIFIVRLTVTVPAVVGPLNAGPPSIEPRLASPDPASLLLTDVSASPEDEPDPSDDPPDEPGEASTAPDEDPTAPEDEDDAPGEPEDDVDVPDDDVTPPDDEAPVAPDDEVPAAPDEPPDDPVEAPDPPPDDDPVPPSGLPPELESHAPIAPLRTAHAAKTRPTDKLRAFLK
ncbi:MAG TPA: hypothetical protein VN894_04940 [Polyangiaceae bacterium]|nr:hypothetical protein [Polyangiaceae bacterium]